MGTATDNAAAAASYVWGTCTWFIAETLSWIPAGLGNADEWLTNARKKGLSTENYPSVGDVVVYGPGHGYDPNYGHVAIVTGVLPAGRGEPLRFTVKEMNAQGLDVVSTRTSTMSDVLGFIKPPNSSSGGGSSSSSSGQQDCSQYNPLDPRYALCQATNAMNAVGNIPNALTDWVSGTADKWAVRIALIALGVILLIIGLVVLFHQQIEQVQTDVGKAATTAGEAAALA